MGNLRRSSKDRGRVGRFKQDGRCKKHSRHRQSPGVCSLCLREKLTQLSTSSSRTRAFSATAASSTSSSSASSASSWSSYHSSSSASSCASPIHRFRFTVEGKSSSSVVSFFLFNGKHGLLKSRSMGVVPRRRDGEGGVGNNKSTKKARFWHKLLHPNQIMQEIH